MVFLYCSVPSVCSGWYEVLPCTKPCGGGGIRVLRRKGNNNDCKEPKFKVDHTCGDCPCKYVTVGTSVVVLIW